MPPLMMLTMGEARDGPYLPDLSEPEGGGIRSTLLEAAPAVESLESMDTECIAVSDELVVEVREVLHGDLDLKLTIRMSDESGDAHEVCDEAFELAACHPAPEEMSSDAVSDLPAGAALGNARAAMWVDEETSGDDREVRAEIVSNARTMADAGMPADAVIGSCTGVSRDTCVAATRLETAEIVTNEADRITLCDAMPAVDVASNDTISDDALRDAMLDGSADCRGCELGLSSVDSLRIDAMPDELAGGEAARDVTLSRMGALDPVRIRAGKRSEMSLAAHARFLQYVFRRAQSRAETTTGVRSAWTRGGLAPYFPMMRPVHAYRCHSGGVAGEDEFETQAGRARAVTAWYACYVRVLARLTESTPAVLSGFCGAGGTDEGVRRAGAVSHGIDLLDQPDYAARFGEEHFTRGDARDECTWREAETRCRPFLRAASPPCQVFSTGRKGEPSQPALIAETRGLLERRGMLWWMENVLGAVHEMSEGSTVLRGAWFGLHVDRGRRFETNFPVHVDAPLLRGEELRARTCLGGRRRWLRLDPFGRPVRTACCEGNLFAVQGSNPTRSSVAENAHAMGVDPSHMRWAGLAQAIPPVYAELLVGQAAMHECWNEFGVPRMSYDDYLADPHGCSRRMSAWLRGAGEAAADAGLELVGPAAGPSTEGVSETRADEVAVTASSSGGATVRDEAPEARGWGDTDWSLTEEDFRSLYYARGGDVERRVTHEGAPRWLDRLVAAPQRDGVRAARGEGGILVHLSEARLDESMREITRAARAGQRMLVLAPDGDAEAARRGRQLRAAGFVSRRVWPAGTEVRIGPEGDRRGWLDAGARAWSCGRRRARPLPFPFDFETARAAMDPLDSGTAPKEDPVRKLERAWEPVPWDPEMWRGKGLKPEVERIMTEGVDVFGPDTPGYYEVPQYPFGGWELEQKGGEEADRAIAAGAMEYVPECEVDELLTDCIVHPWLVVHQGSDKYRACQDYKNGTNLFNDALPFNLPSVWSVRRVIKKGSYMAKYDVRDGFWHVPVKPAARRRLLVRHPTNGRLMRAARLPFGYKRSPEHFCLVTQEMADEFHRRHPNIGAHIFVFVDDFIIIGDDEAACRRGCAAFEELLAEFGIQWAPHKRRGPTQCIEFLGLLICNVEGMRCIGLTEGRLDRVRRELSAWRARRPPCGGGELRVDARELAQMLGHLVFVSQVVPGGRPAMMSMLSSFQGMVVDWKRGRVSVGGGAWRDASVPAGFWEDLEWWEDHLETRHYTPMDEVERRPAVVSGTDASGWGQGGLVWLDGQREEIQLKFTDAERAHPINWRELLGIVRVAKAWGARLRGARLLVETDNMAAYEVSRRSRARVAAMQELVRRLVDCCERHDIELALTHTPGVKLDRPDQTSRGDAVEEPRQRLGPQLFGELAARYGPFTEFVGGERWHPQPKAQSAARVRLWLHPSHATVGSALRLMTTRLREAGAGAEGMIVVPDDQSTQWWTMTRYFSVEGRLRAGAEIQQSRIGQWCPARSRRDALILRFPRTAGSSVRRVIDERGEEPEFFTTAQGPPRLRLLPGAIVMRMNPASRGAAGVEPGAGACWEWFEVLGSWPDVTARGSWLKVEDLATVRSAPNGMRLRASEPPMHRFLDPEGVLLVGGALVERETRRRKTEIVVKLATVAALAARALSVTPEEAPETTSIVVRGGAAAPRAAIAREGGGTPRAGGRAVARAPPTPGAAPAARPSSAPGRWGGWSFGFGASELAARPTPTSIREEDDDELLAEAEVEDETWDVLPAGVVMGQPLDDAEVWPTPSISDAAPRARPGTPAEPVGMATARRAAATAEAVRGAASIPSRVRAGDEYDEAGRALGAYERYNPAEAGQAAIRERTDALQRSLEEMAVGRIEQKCVQSSLVCEGCDKPIIPGEMMIQTGSKWAHADAGCELAGEARHQARVRAELRESAVRPSALGVKTGPAPVNSTAGHTIVKKARALENTYSRDRLDACMLCLEGKCGRMLDKLFCDSCERGVHRECAQLSRTAAMGKMRCTFCRMKELRVSMPAGQMVVDMCTKRMVTELTSRLEATAQGHLSVERLQIDFLNSKLEPGASMIKPVDHEESFSAMLEWMIESGRGNRLDSFLISVAAYFKDTHRPDLTKTDTVKTTLRKMKELNPTRSLPKTTGTSELLKETLLGIADLADTPFLAARETFTTAYEAVSGMRCGEVFGSQMGHGVMANGVKILTWKGGDGYECPPGVMVDEEFVEAATESSKTKVGRCVSMVGKTKGPAEVELAAALRSWWAACEFRIESRMEEGWQVEGPSFWVVQISLMGLTNNATKMEKLRAWLGTGVRASTVARVTEVRKELASELTDKARIKEPDVEKMFINVLGGPKGDSSLEVARGELRELGIMTELTKGPLIFKTKGKSKGGGQDSKWYPQPLQVSSTYAFLHRSIDAAYARLKSRDPEFEMRLGGDRDTPHFAHNTWRRLAATAAQASLTAKRCDKEDVELQMGWQLRKHAKEMRLHYAERGARACRARMTEMI